MLSCYHVIGWSAQWCEGACERCNNFLFFLIGNRPLCWTAWENARHIDGKQYEKNRICLHGPPQITNVSAKREIKQTNKTALETFKGTQYGKHNIKETEGQICAFAFCINMHFPVHQYKKILYSEGQQPWNHPQWSAFSHQWMDQTSMWISVDVGFTSLPDNSSYFINVWDAARCRHGAKGRVWFHFQICILEHAKAIKSGIPTIQLTTFLHLPWIDAVAFPPQAKNK